MSTNPQRSGLDLLLEILSKANTTTPIALTAVTTLINIVKSGRRRGMTDAEIEAEAADSMATALRVKAKSEEQMGDQA